MRLRWPAIYIGDSATRNPLDWLGALVGLLATLGPVILVFGFILIAPIALLIKYIS